MLILDSKQTKALEDAAVSAGTEHIKLMTAAGGSVAKFIRERYNSDGKSVAVLCGRGNNAGDGFAAARKLHECGSKVRILLVSGHPTANDAIDLFGRCDVAGIKCFSYTVPEDRKDFLRSIAAADIIIDAVAGTGFEGSLRQPLDEVFRFVNMSDAKIVSVDIPSGVNSDTGEADENAINADATITFTSMKPGHIVYPGAQHCGMVFVANIGIDPNKASATDENPECIDYQSVRLCFSPRKANSHKGDYGQLFMLCGSEEMPGGAVLAAKSAVQSGVGLVRIAAPRSILPVIASHIVEPVYHALDKEIDVPSFLDTLHKCTSCVAGCAIGTSANAKRCLQLVLENITVPTVLDADALNLIADQLDLLDNSRAPIIITPHPGEMARLIGSTPHEVQRRRLAIAKEFAVEHKVIVVLKGANTIVALPSGKVLINLTGNPGMAQGGSGDVLSGLIGSLLAQGMSPADAAMCGVYIHGACGDRAAKKYSLHAMTPNDIIYEYQSLFLEIER